MTSDIQATLDQRGQRYGEFNEHARITQEIKAVLMTGRSWENCNASQREAMEMIAHKLGRIVNGDPNYDDSWRDIAGYAQLVVNELAVPESVKNDPLKTLSNWLDNKVMKVIYTDENGAEIVFEYRANHPTLRFLFGDDLSSVIFVHFTNGWKWHKDKGILNANA